MDFRLAAALLLWVLLAGIALFPVFKKGEFTKELWRKTFAVFVGALAVALPVWRLHSLLYDGEINVDESQILAQALKYLADPIPWRSVVGGSGGPLNTWVLLWAPLFGLKLGYFAARLTSLFCALGTLTGCALALRHIAGNRLALLLTLPAATLLLTTLNFDFVHFSSEQFPAFLSAWTVYLLAKQSQGVTAIRSFVIGLITGAFPFTKIQVAPAGILLFMLGVGLLWKGPVVSSTSRRSSFLAQVLGGLAVPTLILGAVALAGAWGDFLEFYIRWSLRYSNSGPGISSFDFLFHGAPDFSSFLITLVLVSVGALVLQPFQRFSGFFTTSNLLHGAGLLLFFGSLLYGIQKAGYGFPHYLMLLVVPATVAAGWFTSRLLPDQISAPNGPFPPQDARSAEASKPSRGSKSGPASKPHPVPASGLSPRVVGLGLAAVLLGLFQAGPTFTLYSKNQRLLAPWGQETSPIAEALTKLAKPGDSLCIWGWYPKLHVFSQLRPATRFAVASLSPSTEPEGNPNIRAFLADVQASKPAFFVDAADEFVFPGAAIGSQPRHYSFPEFSRWIQAEYTLIGSPQTAPSRRPILIYKRN